MSAPDYTPTPWKKQTKEERIFISSSGVRNDGLFTNGQDWVCSVWIPKSGEKYAGGHCRRTGIDHQRAEANARLIVKAVPMYQLLKAMLEEHPPVPADDEWTATARDIVRYIEGE